ncbi:uncharacterized protein LOC144164422 isoform X3 [Haemaphysalis longicornis]
MFGETKSGKSRQLCCVQHCTNSYANSSEICFYRFPSLRYAHQHERRETWIRLVRGERTDGAEAWEPKPHSRICSRHFIGNRKSEESCSPSYNPSIFPCVVGKRPTRKLRVTTRGRQGGSAQALRTRASPSRSGRRSAPTRGVRRRCGGSGLRRRGTQFRIRAINRGVQCKLKFSHDVGCQTTFAGDAGGTYSRKQQRQHTHKWKPPGRLHGGSQYLYSAEKSMEPTMPCGQPSPSVSPSAWMSRAKQDKTFDKVQ